MLVRAFENTSVAPLEKDWLIERVAVKATLNVIPTKQVHIEFRLVHILFFQIII